jgi:hypothetical protein
VDYMLYKTIILLFGEVIVSKSLLSSLKWEDTLSNVNAPNKVLELQAISIIGLSRIWRISFP